MPTVRRRNGASKHRRLHHPRPATCKIPHSCPMVRNKKIGLKQRTNLSLPTISCSPSKRYGTGNAKGQRKAPPPRQSLLAVVEEPQLAEQLQPPSGSPKVKLAPSPIGRRSWQKPGGMSRRHSFPEICWCSCTIQEQKVEEWTELNRECKQGYFLLCLTVRTHDELLDCFCWCRRSASQHASAGESVVTCAPQNVRLKFKKNSYPLPRIFRASFATPLFLTAPRCQASAPLLALFTSGVEAKKRNHIDQWRSFMRFSPICRGAAVART